MASVCLALLLGAGAAEAQTSTRLVGTTGQTQHASFALQWDFAQAFQTGSNASGYKLTSMDLNFTVGTPANTTHPTYTVSIMTASGGLPGSSVGTLTNPGSLGGGNSTFTASGGGIDLAADTWYFVVLDVSATDNRDTRLTFTTSDAEDAGAAPGWSVANISWTRGLDNSGSWGQVNASRVARIGVNGYAKVPSVTGVAITSNPGTDNTYQRGDRIRVTATFSEPVTVSGTPHLIFHLIGGSNALQRNRLALYESGSGTNRLVFGYEVQSADNSGSSGIVLPASAIRLNSGTIKNTAGTQNATLTYSTVPVNTSHRTNGSTAATKPAATGATVNGRTLAIAFDGNLNASPLPPANRFRYTRGDGAILHIPRSVAVSGSTATLTLRHTVEAGESVTVRYDAPAGFPRLEGAGGAAVAGFSFDSVTNETTDVKAPTVVDAFTLTTQGGNPAVALRASEAMSEGRHGPATFTLKTGGSTRNIRTVVFAGTGVVLIAMAAVMVPSPSCR